METMIKRDWDNYVRNLWARMKGRRMIAFLLLTFFFMDIYMSPFREIVRIMGEKCNIVVLPFLQTKDFFMKKMFLVVVYFFSNVPFMEKTELFYLGRLGKERWGKRNIFYIAISSVFLTLILFIISVAEVWSVAKVSLSWDAVMKTVALTKIESMKFAIQYEIMDAYQPMELLIHILVLDWLVITMIGLLMYTISLFYKRILATVIAVVLVFLPSIDVWLGGCLVYFSPLSWLDCSNWRIGFDNAKPDYLYMLVASIFVNVLLVVLARWQTRRMEWKPQED